MLTNLHRSLLAALAAVVTLSSSISVAADPAAVVAGPLVVTPKIITLTHRRQPVSIIVTATTKNARSIDLTAGTKFVSSDEKIATVDKSGHVYPQGNGKAIITVTAAGRTATVAVTASIPATERSYSFTHEVMPVLSKGGCNQGSCHGYSLGKNGFKLSLRGADAKYDHAAIRDEYYGRRINHQNPVGSLLVSKPLGGVPHEGGIRLKRGSLEDKILLNWISEGARSDTDQPDGLVSIEVYPKQIVLHPGESHQLQLLARYADGRVRDVTQLGIFTSNTDRFASVDAEGLVTANELGETAIVLRYERKFTVTGCIVLSPGSEFAPTPFPQNHLVDRHIITKLNALKVIPSVLADDTTYLRRAYIDLIGLQPKPEELVSFLADKSPNKREKVVDALFSRSEFVDHWSLKWGDLLQNSRTTVSDPAVFAFREWIRSAVASNMPLDDFARQVLTGRGSFRNSPTSTYYLVSVDENDTLQRATQVFCGMRMLCAKCHPHPFENWTQVDYYGLASFFNQVRTKQDPLLATDRKAKVVLLDTTRGYARNPRTNQLQPPRFLGGIEPKIETGADRRLLYANWLASAENPFFAKSITNRIWSYFFNRGIIDPVDDVRTTNPPINPDLLNALTADFIKHDFNVRHLMKQIVTSQTYQRSTIPNESNKHDSDNFSRALPRRLSAEVLVDCLAQSSNVPGRFGGAPAGFTAAQLPDANVTSEILDLFGKPKRVEACECERDDTSNMLQALHFINSKSMFDRLANGNGRIALLLRQKLADDEIIRQLYLWTIVREPSTGELALARKHLASYAEKKTEALQDLMWALLNSRDFLLLN